MEKEKKDSQLPNEIVKLQKHRIMLWCAIIIIGLLAIAQFALEHCDNKILADQFTFASTISSIILSVIAIIMSVVSGDSINSLLHKIRDLHDEIKDVPDKIEQSVTIMNTSSSKFEKLYEGLGTIPQEISNSSSLMEKVSERLSISLDEFTQLATELQKKTDRLKEELRDEIKDGFKNNLVKKENVEEVKTSLSNRINIDDIDGFFNAVPYWPRVFLFGIKLAKDKGKCFTINDFCDALGIPGSKKEYFWGFMIATKAIGIVRGNIEKRVEYYDPCLNNLRENILGFFSNIQDEKGKFTNPHNDITNLDKFLDEAKDAE